MHSTECPLNIFIYRDLSKQHATFMIKMISQILDMHQQSILEQNKNFLINFWS